MKPRPCALRRFRFLFAWFVVLVASTGTAHALTLRVGTGTGCDHATLGAALTAIDDLAGSHTIRINKGSYATPAGIVYTPTVAQTAVFIEGGYASCTAATPSGDPTSDADRAVLDGTGGAEASVLDLRVNGLIGTVQLRRIKLTGGDATDADAPDLWRRVGGGLAVRGAASVLLGVGASISGNAAVRGGGVVLTGSAASSPTEPPARIDFYITEGAEVSGNTAIERGGGIYCGGGPPPPTFGSDIDRHGSIVFVNGIIGFNQAPSGAAFWCNGSIESGGGLQPRPGDGEAAWIVGNQSTTTTGGCAAGAGTLDNIVPPGGDGWRTLGAANGSTGILAVTNNTGFNAGLCLVGAVTRGTATVPPGENRFRLQNVYVGSQQGRGALGLRASSGINLEVRPSGDTVACEFFAPTACVTVADNAVSSPGGIPDQGNVLAAANDASLSLFRARVRDNLANPQLMGATSDALVALHSSIVDDNDIVANTGSVSGTSLALAQFTSRVELHHATVVMTSPLQRFFRLEDGGTALAHASILSSTVTPAPVNIGGGASGSALTRQWCGFLQHTADFPAHTVVNDPTLGTFVVLAPSALQLEPGTFTPMGNALVDACSAPTYNRDFYGRPFTTLVEAGSPVVADIGAVESQGLPNLVFANGFE